MDLQDEIESFCNRINSEISQKTIKEKVKLYTAGLTSKLLQSNFALKILINLSSKDDHSTVTTDQQEIDIYNQVAFYCDTFCVFVHSCLDVLSQIINQVHRFGMDEKQVDFKRLSNYLLRNHPGSELQLAFNKIENSRSFKNLHKYRNCSVHRRQIYIQEKTELIRHTSGYTISTSGEVSKVVRTLCDDPYEIHPKINQSREIPDYLDDLLDYITKEIKTIIKILPKGI